MTRYSYGGGIADWTFAPAGDAIMIGEVSGQTAIVVGGIAVTYWSQEVGGSQYTDLLDTNGEPLASVVSSDGTDGRAYGQIPPFSGPDGVAEMWAQAGTGPRARVSGAGVTAIDANLAGSLSIDGNLSVAGLLQLAGQAYVQGDITLDGTLNLNDPSQTLFSKTLVVSTPAAGVVPVWRAAKASQVTAVHVYRQGGTGAAVNATVDGAAVLATNLSASMADTWLTGTPAGFAPAAVATGGTLAINVATLSGAPTLLVVQVDLVVA